MKYLWIFLTVVGCWLSGMFVPHIFATQEYPAHVAPAEMLTTRSHGYSERNIRRWSKKLKRKKS